MSKYVVSCEWDEVPHLDPEFKEAMLASYAPHERDARRKGIPSVGSGRIYPISEDDILVEPFPIPSYFKKCYGMDPGQRTTAACWLAQDPNTKIWYIYSEYYKGNCEFAIHASGIKSRGSWIQGACDWAGTADDRRTIINMYAEDFGLLLTPADKSVEAGIQKVWEMLSSGQLKIFSNLKEWIGEFRIYARNDRGQILKRRDHLMDATRYAVMTSLSYATSQLDIDEEEDLESNHPANTSGRDPITGY